MSSAWQQTKNAASPLGRSERGFWIYINTTNMSYECGSVTPGANTSGCEGTNAAISPGSPSETPSASPLNGGKYAVAYFHTHTPLTYCSGARQVGPSSADVSVLSSYDIPGLLYDYAGSYISTEYFNGMGIIGGHNINDPAQIYTFGPNRRSTPNF